MIENYEASETIAEGIAIPNPVRASEMLEAITYSHGTVILVSDVEIISTWQEMAASGYFIEPTSAACIAGLNKYLNGLTNTEICVSLFSGNGLKSIEKISKMLTIY